MAQLQQDFEKMTVQHQTDIAEKNAQIHQMQDILDKFKDNPQTDEFIKEALELSSLLAKQQEIFCHRISLINPYCESSDKLNNQVIHQRLEYDQLNKRILEFSSWQEFEEGKKVDLPNIKESHKDILFTDWDIQLKQTERAAVREASPSNNIIEGVNENLHCYALNLQNNTQTQNMRRKDTQNTE